MFRCPRKYAALTAAAAALMLPACSKDAPPTEGMPAPGAMPPSAGNTADIQAEYASLQQRLGPLQQKAMQDSTLQAEYDALGELVETAMLEINPDLADHRERITAIQGELQGLGQDGDPAKMQALMTEGTSIQQKIQQAQADALQQDSIAAKMTAFQDHVVALMTEMDPETPVLIERVNFLASQIRSGAHPPIQE